MADVCSLLKHRVILMKGTVASYRGEVQVKVQAVAGDQTGTHGTIIQEDCIAFQWGFYHRDRRLAIGCPRPLS